MSRFAGMSPAKRRLWGYGLVAFFVLLIGPIGFSQWWAVNVNVPRLERANAASIGEMTLDWRNLVAVAAGGAFGSSLRYVLGIVSLHWLGTGFPVGTLFINLSGSFAIGLIGEFAIGPHALSSPMRLFVMVGILGGFTTFSAFSLETLGLMINRAPIVPFAYVAGSVVLGIAFCYAGILIGRSLIHL